MADLSRYDGSRPEPAYPTEEEDAAFVRACWKEEVDKLEAALERISVAARSVLAECGPHTTPSLGSLEALELACECLDCGEPFDPVPNSGDKGRCDPCRKQYG